MYRALIRIDPGMMRIRDAVETDFEAILYLNTEEEQQTSPMDRERLIMLHDLSAYHKVATIDDRLVGFLLAYREATPYQNKNYQWFSERYPQFLYIDRVVVATESKGMKVGSTLYKDLLEHALEEGVSTVTCEYNLEPPNLASMAFHEKFGFKEVGTRRVDDSSKTVSLQELKI